MQAGKGRFQKGQSGNPRGRPKGRKNGWRRITEILSQRVTVRRPDGGCENLEMLEISFLALCKRALNGDRQALFKALEIMELVTPEEREPREIVTPESTWAKLRRLVPQIDAPEFKGMPGIDALALVLFGNEAMAELDAKETAEKERKKPFQKT